MPRRNEAHQSNVARLDVIRATKDLADMAKHPDFQGCAYVGFWADGSVVHGTLGEPHALPVDQVIVGCAGEAVNQPQLTAELLLEALSKSQK